MELEVEVGIEPPYAAFQTVDLSLFPCLTSNLYEQGDSVNLAKERIFIRAFGNPGDPSPVPLHLRCFIRAEHMRVEHMPGNVFRYCQGFPGCSKA